MRGLEDQPEGNTSKEMAVEPSQASLFPPQNGYCGPDDTHPKSLMQTAVHTLAPLKAMRVMALSYFIVAFAMLASGLNAADISGELLSFDLAQGELVVASGEKTQKYRFRPSVEVTLNGTKAQAKDLDVGQKVVVTSGDGGMALRIAAKGFPRAASNRVVDAAALKAKLSDTRWSFPRKEIAGAQRWIELKADGTTRAGWHDKDGTWKVLPNGRVDARVSKDGPSFPMIIEFAPDFQSASYQFNGEALQQSHRLVNK
jgi:hypothetical protein